MLKHNSVLHISQCIKLFIKLVGLFLINFFGFYNSFAYAFICLTTCALHMYVYEMFDINKSIRENLLQTSWKQVIFTSIYYPTCNNFDLLKTCLHFCYKLKPVYYTTAIGFQFVRKQFEAFYKGKKIHLSPKFTLGFKMFDNSFT